MPSSDALWRCAGGLGPWSCSSTSPAWIESSMRFSVVSMRTGKPTPSNYLHKQLDATDASARLRKKAFGCMLAGSRNTRKQVRCKKPAWAEVDHHAEIQKFHA